MNLLIAIPLQLIIKEVISTKFNSGGGVILSKNNWSLWVWELIAAHRLIPGIDRIDELLWVINSGKSTYNSRKKQ